ncbi:MAG: pyruvate kinase [Euryarchaeota archaeon TMED117]|nr:MAG: pyruvate kinase [Euryarchaeota archaeon TMED117]|tara:strand:- start:575 stop:2044 length:1470 start_codon:yes stop_codon:yes gene_type:complete
MRSRIIATIGPASDNVETLKQMIEGGMDIARLNYSHGDFSGKEKTIQNIRSAEEEAGKYVGLLADLPGPKLRLGTFEGEVVLERGELIDLHCGVPDGLPAQANTILGEPVKTLPVEWDGLSKDLRVGDPVLLSDGLIRLEVLSAPEHIGEVVRCRVEDGGILTERKGINVPRTLVKLPAVGPHDLDCLEHALSQNVDFVAVSYVRSADDLEPARERIKEAGVHTWIVAKIEHPAALKDLNAIVEAADVVMVARGDLGVEIPLEEVPAAQERIVSACLERGTPVVVATQMLESMVNHARPTRAEVTDVATAIRQHVSAVMLSGETAGGQHPVKAVETMARIAETVDASTADLPEPPALAAYVSTRVIAGAAVDIARQTNVNHLIVATEHGNAARLMAAHRPRIPIYAMTNRIRAARRTTILPGVEGLLVEEKSRARSTVAEAVRLLYEQKKIKPDEKIVAISGSPQAISGRTSTIRLLQVQKDGELSDLE